MDGIKNPTKQQVHEYMLRRFASKSGPASIEQIRRELGWKLIQHARTKSR